MGSKRRKALTRTKKLKRKAKKARREIGGAQDSLDTQVASTPAPPVVQSQYIVRRSSYDGLHRDERGVQPVSGVAQYKIPGFFDQYSISDILFGAVIAGIITSGIVVVGASIHETVYEQDCRNIRRSRDVHDRVTSYGNTPTFNKPDLGICFEKPAMDYLPEIPNLFF